MEATSASVPHPLAVNPAPEFAQTARWTAVSDAGFTVRLEDSNGVSYFDAGGRIFLDAEGRVFLEAEWLVDGVRIHLDSPRNGGFERATPARVDEVLERIVRGLRFLGYQCEMMGRVRNRARMQWAWPR